MAVLPVDVNEFSEEIREASPANFLIKIESFSLLSKYEIDKYESRVFEAGGYKWKLIMYFEGNESENEGRHVSVNFSIAETDSLGEGWEVNAVFTFFLHNQLLDTYLCFRGMTRRFNAVNPKWGFSKLISMESLMDPSKGYVVDDTCVFGAEVYVIKTQRVNECLSLVKDTAAQFKLKRGWKILDFSKLEKDVWNSEKFQVGNHNWKVVVYPKGYSTRRYVSIFVECVDAERFATHHKVKAEVCISIKSNLNDNTYYSRKFNRWYTSSCKDWGFVEFIEIADMSSGGFLPHDCCFLEIELTVQALALDAPKI